MNKALAVRTGSVIGIAATGSPVSPERLALGISELEKRGFGVRLPLDPSKYYGKYDHGFACGSAEQRASALMELVEDDQVSAILAARGGYGTLDVLPLIDFEKIRASRKLLIGCSDVSALLVQNVVRASLPAIHGATLASSFADSKSSTDAKSSVDALLEMISVGEYRYSMNCEQLSPGEGEGRVLAGNLTVLTTLLGTPWDIDYQGAVLVLEEVGEAPFRVHRALTQLKLAGKLDSLAALIYARFSRCQAAHGPRVEDVLSSSVSGILGNPNYPVLCGFEMGHWGRNEPLPLGCRARVSDGCFSLLESPLESGIDESVRC